MKCCIILTDKMCTAIMCEHAECNAMSSHLWKCYGGIAVWRCRKKNIEKHLVSCYPSTSGWVYCFYSYPWCSAMLLNVVWKTPGSWIHLQSSSNVNHSTIFCGSLNECIDISTQLVCGTLHIRYEDMTFPHVLYSDMWSFALQLFIWTQQHRDNTPHLITGNPVFGNG